jgi:hypothetical protein
MVGRQPDVPRRMVELLHRLHAVVPNVQNPTQPMASPDAISRPDVLDGARAVLGAHECAFADAGVAAGSEPFDVLGGMRAVQLGLAAVGPADDRTARRLHEAGAGVGVADAAGAFVHGGDAVTEGRGDDRYPVRHRTGKAGRPVDVLPDVLGARLRLPGATAGHEKPARPRSGWRDLVGLWLPAGFELGSEEGSSALGDCGPVLGGHDRIVTGGGGVGFRVGRRLGRGGRCCCAPRGATSMSWPGGARFWLRRRCSPT